MQFFINREQKALAEVKGCLCEQILPFCHFDPQEMGARRRQKGDRKIKLCYDYALRTNR